MTSTADLGHAAAHVPQSSPERAEWTALQPLIIRLHFYAGILIAPFLPLMGISLAAFLVIDVLLGLRSRRRARQP
ncbi:hypothetical protein [Nonomuraea sp. GTA35]|uniref:hypothetical protein n=1 Tax=Nonomuraea sp. GTA35 TaxID=1676746 RepID=UPI0035BF9667